MTYIYHSPTICLPIYLSTYLYLCIHLFFCFCVSPFLPSLRLIDYFFFNISLKFLSAIPFYIYFIIALGIILCFLNLSEYGVDILMLYAKCKHVVGFPGGAAVENLPANAGDTGSSPDLGRSHMPQSN